MSISRLYQAKVFVRSASVASAGRMACSSTSAAPRSAPHAVHHAERGSGHHQRQRAVESHQHATRRAQ
jgi:hypothetical protein